MHLDGGVHLDGGLHLDGGTHLGGGSHLDGGMHHGHDAGDSADSPSPFNPLVIASCITVFGAAGLIGKLALRMGDLASSGFALGFAALAGITLFYGVVRIMYKSQSNTTFSLNQLAGTPATIITPIPGKGLGELSCVVNGIRYNLAAKALYDEDIARGEEVVIVEVADNVARVARRIQIDEVDPADMFDRNDLKKKETNNNQKGDS